jgi:cyclophilin family peptidyl-prolyl cis-trans isomerase
VNLLRFGFFILTTLHFVSFSIASAASPAATSSPTKKENSNKGKTVSNPVVIIETSKGTMEAELWEDKAPITVKNFLAYADEKFFDNTIFHRVIPGFMIQGGGMTADMKEKQTKAPIKNEATAELKNLRGTLAMARTNVVDSATSQFFINSTDNDFLNHTGTGPQTYGYAVFGKVTKGLETIDAISKVPTKDVGFHQNVPAEPVVIISIRKK